MRARLLSAARRERARGSRVRTRSTTDASSRLVAGFRAPLNKVGRRRSGRCAPGALASRFWLPPHPGYRPGNRRANAPPLGCVDAL